MRNISTDTLYHSRSYRKGQTRRNQVLMPDKANESRQIVVTKIKTHTDYDKLKQTVLGVVNKKPVVKVGDIRNNHNKLVGLWEFV